MPNNSDWEDRIEEAARALHHRLCRQGPYCSAHMPPLFTLGVVLQRLYDDGGSYWKHKHDNLERYAVQLREDYAKLRAERDVAYDDGKKDGAEEYMRKVGEEWR